MKEHFLVRRAQQEHEFRCAFIRDDPCIRMTVVHWPLASYHMRQMILSFSMGASTDAVRVSLDSKLLSIRSL